jgi:putative Holliday junction resolvase
MRVLALDVGRRRVGFAISDPLAMLARPLMTIDVSGADAVDRVAVEIERLAAEEDGLGTVVIGLPRRLDGAASAETAHVEKFIARLATRVRVPIATEDERLSSREAESRLALQERDWRKRKAMLDAAAAAVILQDYLDRHSDSRTMS